MVCREAAGGGDGCDGRGMDRCDGAGEAVSWCWTPWEICVAPSSSEGGTFSPVSVLSSGSTGGRWPSSLRRTRNGLLHDEQRTLKRSGSSRPGCRRRREPHAGQRTIRPWLIDEWCSRRFYCLPNCHTSRARRRTREWSERGQLFWRVDAAPEIGDLRRRFGSRHVRVALESRRAGRAFDGERLEQR